MFAIVAAFLFIGGTSFSLIVIGDMLLRYRDEIMAVVTGRPLPGAQRAEVVRGVGYAPRTLMELPQASLPLRPQCVIRPAAVLRAHA